MAHKSFAVPDETVEAPEDITFDLASEKDFKCRQRTNGKLLMDRIAKVDSLETERQVEGIIEVFDITVLPDDGEHPDQYTGKWEKDHSDAELEYAELHELEVGVDPTSSLGRLTMVLNDPNTQVDVDELAELVGWLVERYVGRPTKSAPNLPRGVTSMKGTSRQERRTRARRTDKQRRSGSSTSSTDLSPSSA